MSLEEQNGNILKKGAIITDEEAKFITESGQPPLYVEGMLSMIRRTGEILEKVYKQAISEPGNEEHIPAVQKARDFLAENSEKFGLIIPPDKSI